MNFSDYANLPADKPPPGVIPNFDHPQSRAIIEYIGVSICLGVALIFVSLRTYVRLALRPAWGWDDGACILGYGLVTAYAGVNFSLSRPGKSDVNHAWEIKLGSFTKGFYRSLAAQIALYAGAAFFIKLSLFLLYFRLFKPEKTTRWLVNGGIFVSGLFYSVTMLICIVTLVPRGPSWYLQGPNHELRLKTIPIAQGAFNVLSDIYLLVIPIRSIFQLHLCLRRKFEISSIFLIGILAVSCSVASLFYRVRFLFTDDFSWFNALIWTLATAELCAGIICSCMPILKILFGDHASQKPHFASLTTFISRLRIFRQQSMSQQSHSFERLNPIQVNDHSEGKVENSIKSNGEIESAKPNEAI